MIPPVEVGLWVKARYAINYEPSWFGEAGTTIGLLAWGYLCLVDPRQAGFTSYILPVLSLVIGMTRAASLQSFNTGARALGSMAGACLWLVIVTAYMSHRGMSPLLGGAYGMVVIDLLNVVKFSLPYVNDLYNDIREVLRRCLPK